MTSSGGALWYLTRATGAVSLLLLTASVVLGIANQVRWTANGWQRWPLQRIHRNVSLFVLAFIGVHVVTAVLDRFAPIGLKDAVVPFMSGYRPLWLGLGALAFDLLIAIVVTSLVRARLGYRTWRAVHWLTYASWPIAVLHGLGTGSDTRLGWMLVLTVACMGAVILAVWWRVSVGWPQNISGRVAGILASVLTPLALAGFLFAGPMRAGWAKTAGTPAALLVRATSLPAVDTARASIPNGPFTGDVTGTLAQRRLDNGGLRILIDANITGEATGIVHVEIDGVPLSDGEGVSMAGSSATFGTSSDPTLYQGEISSLDGSDVLLALSSADANRAPLSLELRLRVDQQTGDITGIARGTTSG